MQMLRSFDPITSVIYLKIDDVSFLSQIINRSMVTMEPGSLGHNSIIGCFKPKCGTVSCYSC